MSFPMAPRFLDLRTVDALRAVALRFGPLDATAKTRALSATASCARDRRRGPMRLPRLPAVPRSRIRKRARCATPRARNSGASRARRRELFDSGPARTRAKLANSGIACTDVTINFGWDIARWLVERFPRRADIDSFGERRLAAAGGSWARRSRRWSSSSRRGRRDTARISRGQRASASGARASHGSSTPCCDCHAPMRCAPRSSTRCSPSSSSGPADSLLSRTFARGLPAPTYYHRDALPRRIDLPALVDLALPAPRRLSRSERQQVVDAGRAVLAALGRETDAIALAYGEGVRYYDLRARHGARALHDAARSTRPARFAHRHDAVQERRARRLWRRLALPRHVPDRRQRVRSVSAAASRRCCSDRSCACTGNASASGASSPSPRSSAARTAKACAPARSGSTTGSGSVRWIRRRRDGRAMNGRG